VPNAEVDDTLNLQYLYAELRRIDALIQREVRRWQLAGQNPSDDFRGLYLSDEQATALVERPFGLSWGQTVELPPDEEKLYTDAANQATIQAQLITQKAQKQGATLRLQHLANTFALNRFALDAFLICLAPHLDLRYEAIYGYLQDDVTRTHPTINLILNLLCSPGTPRLRQLPHFFDEAPLLSFRLLQHGPDSDQHPSSLLSQRLDVDPAIVAWLLGTYRPPREMQGQITMSGGQRQEDQILAPTVPEIHLQQEGFPLIIFYGPDALAQDAAARLTAARLDSPLLTLHLAAITEETVPRSKALSLALRDARLNSAVPYIKGWDAYLRDGHPPTEILAELYAHPGPLIIGGERRWHARGVTRDRPLLWVEFPLPNYRRRRMLWEHFVGEGPSDDPATLESLAGQFTLTTEQVRDAAATARDQAAQRDDKVRAADLLAAARAHSNPRLADLAHKITPRYTWDDIILPEDRLEMLREVVVAVRERPKVLDAWGVGQKLAASRGVTMLFAGPPGTGKTMAAEVIASELSLDLYRIDLSTIISKYIGETEKNLEKIFNEAQHSNAILFFDEADAIFGKRSEVKDAHDRYANIETSYLLQRMENYDGVTILATNLRANLDEAFTRRLQFAIDFPAPEKAYRQRIWETLFPPDVPRSSDLDFAPLARRFKLTGGNIRNVIVAAAYLAAAEDSPVTMRHLLHATRRELQKMGRLVNEEDFQIPSG
jgi:ATP-dependent 26S proteasome regulatory subunit